MCKDLCINVFFTVFLGARCLSRSSFGVSGDADVRSALASRSVNYTTAVLRPNMSSKYNVSLDNLINR